MNIYPRLLAATVALLTLNTGRADDAKFLNASDALFALKVEPILAEKCYSCHGDKADDVKGELDLTSREGFFNGGESVEEILVPGKPDESFLLEVVKWENPNYEMPPKENDRLTTEQIDALADWIQAGAPWPTPEIIAAVRQAERKQVISAEGRLVETSGGLSDAWTYRRYQKEDIWAFLPVERPKIPNANAENPIDAFVHQRLHEADASPAPEAEPRDLIRRAYYDLHGLPPTNEEIQEFAQAYKNDPDQTWNALIDRLLASKRYGERWAQHWLDVARYADSGGYSNDYERSNAWRYRDYVIRSLNNDKPYDTFITEQLAGDELADQELRSRSASETEFHRSRIEGDYTPQEAEWLVASSFLRMGPWDSAMIKKSEARQIYIDDVVNGVGQTFLATTMRCFKCHDHKFDPLPTRDYYRMYAVFEGVQLAERPAPFLAEENLARFDSERALTQRLLDFAAEKKNALIEKRENAARAWYQENKKEYLNLQDRKDLPDDEKPPRHVGLNATDQGRLKVREQDEWIWKRRLERYEPMIQSVYNGPVPNYVNARKLRLPNPAPKEGTLETSILLGGSLQAPDEKVQPGVLSAIGLRVPNGVSTDPYALPTPLDGRRIALAQWNAHEENPLTTRSIVNRIWQYHFGKPIAGNPNNFGAKGEKPTHPRLLDWLTSEFIENGWKMKYLHRLIMMSETYRQASLHPDRGVLEERDPNNDLFAYFPIRRLSAEEIRDSMLSISGELNLEVGGLPVMPEMNMNVALQPRMIQFSIAPAYQPSRTPEVRNRRSIYAYRVRGLPDPFLESFNQPNPNDSCERRDSAAVPPQAFTLFNSDVARKRSVALAQRIAKTATTASKRVQTAFELALGRRPSDLELEKMTKFVANLTERFQNTNANSTHYPTSITRSLVEEFTGKPFNYTEILPAYENYVPDPTAADVSPDIQGLAELCLLLINTHEFNYIY